MNCHNAFSALSVSSTDSEESESESKSPVKEAPKWEVASVQSADIQYGFDMWPSKLLPPIPDVPCYSCRARTHMQGTCPLLLCMHCGLYGHHERYCQKSSSSTLR